MVFINVSSPIGMDFAFPDVCLTPIIVPVPIPYPNIAMRIMAVDFCFNITIWAMPAHHLLTTIPMTMGDQPGVNLGILSGMVMGPSRNITCSLSVMLEGFPATRWIDLTMQNGFFGNMVGMTLIPGQFNTIALV